MDNLENKHNGDDILGLDENIEEEYIHIENINGEIYKFEVENLKDIDLIQSIIKSDNTAGKSVENSIKLPILNEEIFNLIIIYIKKHGSNDYKAIDNLTDSNLTYSQRMTLWDRNFINEIVLKDQQFNTNNLNKLLDASAYLMYNTLYSKICCYLANCEKSDDYKEIFRELTLIE